MTANAPADINQLQELAVAAPDVSYLPQTWGWALLAGLLVILVALVYWRRRTHWRRDLYRREALARLAFIEQHIDDPAQRAEARKVWIQRARNQRARKRRETDGD